MSRILETCSAKRAFLLLLLLSSTLCFAQVSVSVGPLTAAVQTGRTKQFKSAVSGTSNTGVTWSVDGISGGNASVGTISATGLYTPPSSFGTHTIRARSVVDTSKTGSATAYVFTTVNADFATRNNQTKLVRSGSFGGQLSALNNQNVENQMGEAGFDLTRTYAKIPQVYGSTTPNWTLIDNTISMLRIAGLHPIMQMAFTPSWLQPSPNPCTSSGSSADRAMPTDVNRWAQLAASYVKHFDTKYPGFVQDYEIWNEPNLQYFFCASPNTESQRMANYLKLYAAAAKAMYDQAKLDGATIRVGGPASAGNPSAWIQALTTNPATALYVGFISYHSYVSGQAEINAGMNWDSSTATTPLYQRTQGGAGLAVNYLSVFGNVKKGTQPGGANTPIYLDEYNDNWAFAKDCCRNNATYGPLWNTLVFADLLNTVYQGAVTPPKFVYYAASNPPYFCLFGTINANMDCSTSSMQPYPQFYAFKLFADEDYLGLRKGGHMAASVYPPITRDGLAVTAFYTATSNSLVVVNPTRVDYTGLKVQLVNAGISSAKGTLYTLNASNPTITTQSLSLTPSGSGYVATISVPHYSTVAIRLNP